MGFYIRKSFKLGPLRLNLQRSGLGASVGTKGARLGLSAKGKLYTHLGRWGLYQRHDLWSHELGYLEFRYFDGVEWSTSWQLDEGNPLPQMIQVTVGFDSISKIEWEDQDLETYPLDRYPFGPDVPQENRYTTIVRLPAADQMLTSRMQNLGNKLKPDEVYQLLTGAPLPGGTAAQKDEGGGK